MKLTFTLPEHKHRFWHKMKEVRQEPHRLWGYLLTGAVITYHECTKCKTRMIIQNHDGYQPIDKDWLHFKDENI